MLAYLAWGQGPNPGSDIFNKMKYEKIYLRYPPLRSLLAKILSAYKIAMESITKICRKSWYSCIKLIHISKKLGRNPDWKVVMRTYIYTRMYVVKFCVLKTSFWVQNRLTMTENMFCCFLFAPRRYGLAEIVARYTKSSVGCVG